MEINISDFLGTYPQITNVDFSKRIQKKREFAELRLPPVEEKPEKQGELLKHQKFIRRFISPETPYNELLLWHSTGTGKSCSAIAVAEAFKNSKLNSKRALVLMHGDTIEANFKQQLVEVCTSIDEYREEDGEELTLIKRNRKIAQNYEFWHFFSFLNQRINKLDDSELIRRYSNRIIIIDEAHNLRIQKKSKQKDKTLYDGLHRFLHIVRGCKILLLTATPMIDGAHEIASLMNFILPMNQQIITDKEKFHQEYLMSFSKEKGEWLISPKKIRKLTQYLVGRISHVRSMILSNAQRIDRGKVEPFFEYMKAEMSRMREFQAQVYQQAWIKDSGKESGIYNNSKDASLFVFPDGKYGNAGFESNVNAPMQGTFGFTFKPKSKGLIKKEIDEGRGVRKFSSKYYKIISKIEKSEGLNFVYNERVMGSGLIVFGLLLELYGYKRMTAAVMDNIIFLQKDMSRIGEFLGKINTNWDEKLEKDIISAYSSQQELNSDFENYKIISSANTRKKELTRILTKYQSIVQEDFDKIKNQKRYGLITGGESNQQTERILRVFNSPDNFDGKIIKVILGSRVIGEGRTLKNIQHIHITTPWWNSSKTEQAIGRGIRAFSHEDLENDYRRKLYEKMLSHNLYEKREGKWNLLTNNEIEFEMTLQKTLVGENKPSSDVGENGDLYLQVLNDTERKQAIKWLRGPQVNVYRHVATLMNQQTRTIDVRMYQSSERKDKKIKIAERLMKEIAVDCTFNYPRNLPRNKLGELIDQPGSRDCDYLDECEYQCYNAIPGDQYVLPESELDYETFRLYYRDEEMQKIEQELKDLFRMSFSIHLNDIVSSLSHRDPHILRETLIYLITRYVKFRDRYGFPAFLRNVGDIFFLVRDLNSRSDYLLKEYVEFPIFYDGEEFVLQTEKSLLQKDIVRIQKFLNQDKTPEEYHRFLNSLNPEMQIYILESFIKLEFTQTLNTRQQNVVDRAKEAFFSYFIEDEDMVVHQLDKKMKRKGGKFITRCFSKEQRMWENCPQELTIEYGEQFIDRRKQKVEVLPDTGIYLKILMVNGEPEYRIVNRLFSKSEGRKGGDPCVQDGKPPRKSPNGRVFNRANSGDLKILLRIYECLHQQWKKKKIGSKKIEELWKKHKDETVAQALLQSVFPDLVQYLQEIGAVIQD